MEVRGWGPGWPGPIDESKGFGGQAGLATSIKVRDLGGRAGLGPVDNCEGLGGRAGLGPVDKSETLGPVSWSNPKKSLHKSPVCGLALESFCQVLCTAMNP